jgi:G2/mitotic-specific cyclin-B3
MLRKRKAELSPRNERNKRAALGNLTNALKATDLDENLVKKQPQLTKKSSQEDTTSNGIKPISSRTRGALKSQNENDFQQPNQSNNVADTKSKSNPEKSSRISRRISNEFEKTEDSLYVSALEEIPSDSSRLSNNTTGLYRTISNTADATLSQTSNLNEKDNLQFERPLPTNVEDFDRENWRDIFQVSNYAMNIFEYLKQREKDYNIKDYMSNQPELSKWMRSLLIDWMVEVQESFELNHETLYLAVKIVDSFLGREKVTKDCLQLLGAAALLIAIKNHSTISLHY